MNHGQFEATDNTEYRAYRAVISPISKRGGDFARNREKNIRASAFSVHVPAATNSKAATFRYIPTFAAAYRNLFGLQYKIRDQRH